MTNAKSLIEGLDSVLQTQEGKQVDKMVANVKAMKKGEMSKEEEEKLRKKFEDELKSQKEKAEKARKKAAEQEKSKDDDEEEEEEPNGPAGQFRKNKDDENGKNK